MDVTNGFANAHVRQRSAEARTALDELVRAMDACVGELRDARRRAVELGEQYDSGQSWTAIVSAETPPLVVERITITLDTLSMKGSQWRRTQARAARRGRQHQWHRRAVPGHAATDLGVDQGPRPARGRSRPDDAAH